MVPWSASKAMGYIWLTWFLCQSQCLVCLRFYFNKIPNFFIFFILCLLNSVNNKETIGKKVYTFSNGCSFGIYKSLLRNNFKIIKNILIVCGSEIFFLYHTQFQNQFCPYNKVMYVILRFNNVICVFLLEIFLIKVFLE